MDIKVQALDIYKQTRQQGHEEKIDEHLEMVVKEY